MRLPWECLRQPVWKPYTREVRADTLLTKHVDFLTGRAPEVRYSARILFQELQKQHQYTGGYDTVRRFVHPLRTALEIAGQATMRFETAPGEHYGESRVMLSWVAMPSPPV
jgi:hypothetical protein